MGRRADGVPRDREAARMTEKQLTRPELLDMRSVLERSLQRAERDRREDEAEQLARAVADLNDELARRVVE